MKCDSSLAHEVRGHKTCSSSCVHLTINHLREWRRVMIQTDRLTSAQMNSNVWMEWTFNLLLGRILRWLGAWPVVSRTTVLPKLAADDFYKKILVLGLSLIIRGAWAEWEEINRVVDADREASAGINNEPNTDKSDHNQILKSGVRRGVNSTGWRVPFSL